MLKHALSQTQQQLRCYGHGVRGTRRALLIDRWAAKIGMPVDQQAFGIDLLQRAEEVCYCNALLGLRPIAAAAGCSWPEHPVCEALQGIYQCENSSDGFESGEPE